MSLTDDILMHYGMPRRSGRYPWGSGDNPYQHSGDFLSRVEELKKSNFTFTDKDGKTYTGEVIVLEEQYFHIHSSKELNCNFEIQIQFFYV